jgi:hypothetical protein
MTETVHSAPQLGRRSQAQQVRGYLADLAAGPRAGPVVEGEPGIGKSE